MQNINMWQRLDDKNFTSESITSIIYKKNNYWYYLSLGSRASTKNTGAKKSNYWKFGEKRLNPFVTMATAQH